MPTSCSMRVLDSVDVFSCSEPAVPAVNHPPDFPGASNKVSSWTLSPFSSLNTHLWHARAAKAISVCKNALGVVAVHRVLGLQTIDRSIDRSSQLGIQQAETPVISAGLLDFAFKCMQVLQTGKSRAGLLVVRTARALLGTTWELTIEGWFFGPSTDWHALFHPDEFWLCIKSTLFGGALMHLGGPYRFFFSSLRSGPKQAAKLFPTGSTQLVRTRQKAWDFHFLSFMGQTWKPQKPPKASTTTPSHRPRKTHQKPSSTVQSTPQKTQALLLFQRRP